MAQRSEERSRYGWSVTLHPNGDRYVLRNIGTRDARDVRFANHGSFVMIAFDRHSDESGPCIASGESRAFTAKYSFGQDDPEVVIEWTPEGETGRRVFTEVLPPAPNQMREIAEARQRQNAVDRAEHRQDVAETRRLLLELASAWANYVTDTSNVAAKMRVQALVAALPSNYAREIGYAVDVPRDFWGPGQWPFEDLVTDEAAKRLVAKDAVIIELIWNMLDVQIDPITRADESATWDQCYRIEEAVPAYAELVRRREEDDRELRASPNDLRQHAEARKMIMDAQRRLEAREND
ncbi:hypothetical protein [Nocardia beijingensis]|uniref:Uncharacterized protein n=1 Tax=Nocardia beijingensis TaxID=95162 RepID=A0ABW7WSH8_9NOCA